MKIILLTAALFLPLAVVASGLAIENARQAGQDDQASPPITMSDDAAADRADADAREGYALDRLAISSGPFLVPDFSG